jgi:hypothetical protein
MPGKVGRANRIICPSQDFPARFPNSTTSSQYCPTLPTTPCQSQNELHHMVTSRIYLRSIREAEAREALANPYCITPFEPTDVRSHTTLI